MKILLVDDEEIILEILKDDIVDSFPESTVICAIDGVAALELFNSEGDFTLVITDIKMPRMNGLELIEEINKKDSPPPVIVVSGHIDRDIDLNYGNKVDILTKPYDFEVLEELIKNH